jgi:hypothetical protein
MTSHYTLRGPVTTLLDFGGVLGTAFGHFLWDFHNFVVTAFGGRISLFVDLDLLL